jgi:dephospho-CoA kinase
MHRVAIIGGPRTGKTTKARGAACAGVEVCETDAWKGMAWSAQSGAAADAARGGDGISGD